MEEEMEVGCEGPTATAGALMENAVTKMEEDPTENLEEDEYLNLKGLIRTARYRTLEDQPPVADEATYLEEVAKKVLVYLRKNTDKTKKFGLGCIMTTLDVGGKRKKVDYKVAILMDLADFLPVLEQFFTCQGKQVELKCLGVKIYGCLVEGIGCNLSLSRKIDEMDFLKHFLPMLSSNDEALMEQAVYALAETALSMYLRPSLLSCAPFIFSQLDVFMVSHPCNSVVRSPAICSILSNLLVAPMEIRLSVEKAYRKRDNSFNAIIIRGGILPRREKDGSFVLDDLDVRAFFNENLTFKKHFPSVSVVQSAVPLIEFLLDSVNDKTLLHVLHALTYLLRSFKVNRRMLFLKRQLCRNLVSIFERSHDELVLSFVCLSIEYLAGMNREDMFLFLQNVKGTIGLQYYWKTLDYMQCASPLDDNQPGIKFASILDFLKGAVSITRETVQDISGVKAIIDSGLHITFLNLLKPPRFLYQNEARIVAISGIHSILAFISNDKSRALCESQIIKYLGHIVRAMTTDFGEYSPHSNALVTGILGHVVFNNSDNRDKAIREGAIRALLKVVRMVTSSGEPGSMSNVMCCLDKIMASKPPPKLEDIKDLVGGISWLWGSMPPPEVSVLADVRILVPLKVLVLVAKFGVDGVDLITSGGEEEVEERDDDKKKFLLRRIVALTVNSNNSVQTLAMEVILGICKGTTIHRKMVVEMGILRKFKLVLKEGSPVPRRISLNCLDAFIAEDILTFEQKKFVQTQLSPLVKAEEKLMLSETHLAAQFVNEKIIRLFYPFPPAPAKYYD